MKLTSEFISDEHLGVMPLYSDTCRKIDDALSEIRGMSSTESLAGNFFGRAIVAVCDTFTGLLSTFVTNITKFHKNLKRSELREFCQSNRMKVSCVSNSISNEIGDVKVYAPAGMSTSYCEAIDTLSLIYVQLNAVETARTMQAALQEIFSQMSSGDKSVTKHIASASNYISTVIKASKQAVLKCQKDFSSDRADTVLWKTVYPALTDIKLSIEKLLSLEPRLQDVHKLAEMAQQMETVVRGIVDLVKNNNVSDLAINNKDIVNLGETAKQVALVFDSYSMAATRQMTLEHNTVLNINALYKAMN